MKRFIIKKKSKKLRDQAMADFKALKRKFEDDYPELMDDLRSAIAAQSAVEAAENNEYTPIDKKRNLSVILQFLSAEDTSDDFKNKVKLLLASAQK